MNNLFPDLRKALAAEGFEQVTGGHLYKNYVESITSDTAVSVCYVTEKNTTPPWNKMYYAMSIIVDNSDPKRILKCVLIGPEATMKGAVNPFAQLKTWVGDECDVKNILMAYKSFRTSFVELVRVIEKKKADDIAANKAMSAELAVVQQYLKKDGWQYATSVYPSIAYVKRFSHRTYGDMIYRVVIDWKVPESYDTSKHDFGVVPPQVFTRCKLFGPSIDLRTKSRNNSSVIGMWTTAKGVTDGLNGKLNAARAEFVEKMKRLQK